MPKANPKGTLMPWGYKRRGKRVNLNNGPPSKQSHPTAKYRVGMCGVGQCKTDRENEVRSGDYGG